MSEFKKVAKKAEVAAGSGKAVEVDWKTVAVFNVEGEDILVSLD